MDIEYQIKFPEFLSKLSYYSNNYIRKNSNDLNIEEEINNKSVKFNI